MSMKQADHEKLLTDLRFSIKRVGQYDRREHRAHLSRPYYLERGEKAARAAEIFISNRNTREYFAAGKVIGALILPENVQFDRPPHLQIRYEVEKVKGYQSITIPLELDPQHPNVAGFSFIKSSPSPDSSIRIHELHFMNLYYKNLHRNPGQAVITEIFLDQQCFPQWNQEVRKKIVNMLLYTRGLGMDNASNGIIPLGSSADCCNITNGNHYMNIPLFSSRGMGVSTNLSLHYNSWNAFFARGIIDLNFYNSTITPDSPFSSDTEYFTRLSGWQGGWHHSYALRLMPYVLPEDEEGLKLRDYLELQTGYGNRLQFRKADELEEYTPLYESDAFYGDNNLLLSMKIIPGDSGYRLEGKDGVKYLFDRSGELAAISDATIEQSNHSVEALRMTGVWYGDRHITDSANRVTLFKNTHPTIIIKNAKDQEFILTIKRIEHKYKQYWINTSKEEDRTWYFYVIESMRMPDGKTFHFEYDEDSGALIKRKQPDTYDFVFKHIGKEVQEESKRDFFGRLEEVTFEERHFMWTFNPPGKEKQKVTFQNPRGVKFEYNCLKDTLAVESITCGEKGKTHHLAAFEYLPGTRMVRKYTNLNGFNTIKEYKPSGNWKGSFLLKQEKEEIKKGEEVYITKYDYWPGTEYLKTVTDPAGNETIISYYPNGLPQRVTYPKLDNSHLPEEEKKALDKDGRAYEEWTYTPKGQEETHRSRRGIKTEYSYDDPSLDPRGTGLPTGRTIKVLDLAWKMEYDVLGNVLKSFEPLYGGWSETEYDNLNRIEKTISPEVDVPEGLGERRHIITCFYNSAGRLGKVTDNYGNITTYQYTKYGELKKSINVNGGASEIRERDLNGNPLVNKNPRGKISHFEYDALNRVKRITSPQPSAGEAPVINEWEYRDSESTVITRIGKREIVSRSDGLGRIVETTVKFPSADDEGEEIGAPFREVCMKVLYQDKGKKIITEGLEKGVSRERFELVFSREEVLDEWGRTTSITHQGVSTTLRRYDLEDNVIEVLPPEVPVVGPCPGVRFEYDELNRLTRKIDAYNVVNLKMIYHDARKEGNPAKVDLLSHDPAGNLFEKRRTSPFIEPQEPTDMDNILIEEYNALGKLVASWDCLSKRDGGPPTTQIKYDARGLPLWQSDENKRVTEYRYDAVGRVSEEWVHSEILEENPTLLEELKNPGCREEFPNKSDYFNAGPKILKTSYKYDANGNLETITDPSGRTYKFIYDALDRPVQESHPGPNQSVSRLFRKYKYDCYGRKMEITNETLIKQTIARNDALKKEIVKIEDKYTAKIGDKIVNVGGAIEKEFDWGGKLTYYNDSRSDLYYRYEYDELRNIYSITTFKKENDKYLALLIYGHDAAGNRTKLSFRTEKTPGKDIYYEYNANFNPWDIEVKFPSTGHKSLKFECDYNLAGQIHTVARPQNCKITTQYNYDKIGRLEEVLENKGKRTIYSHTLKYQSPEKSRQIEEVDYRCWFNEGNEKDFNGNIQNKIATFKYLYTRDGRLTDITEKRVKQDFTSKTFWGKYFYDASGRMTHHITGTQETGRIVSNITMDQNAPDGSLNASWHLPISFHEPDRVEEPAVIEERPASAPWRLTRKLFYWIQKEPFKVSDTLSSRICFTESSQVFAKDERLYQFNYKTQEMNTIYTEVNLMRYNPSGQLEFLYKKKGEKEETDYYIYDGDTLIARMNEDGVVQEFYVCAPGINNRLAVDVGGKRCYHNDYKGSTLFLSHHPTGEIMTFYGPKGPYGEHFISSPKEEAKRLGEAFSTPPEHYLFAGMREMDNSLGYLAGHRWYDSRTHRFITKDPQGLRGGPDLYGYAGGNPVGYIDPDGKIPILVAALIGGIISTLLDAGVQYGTTDEYDWRLGALAFLAGAVGGGITGWSARQVASKSISVAKGAWINFFGDVGTSLSESYVRTTAIEGHEYTRADLGRDLLINTIMLGTLTGIQRGFNKTFDEALETADRAFANKTAGRNLSPRFNSKAAVEAVKTPVGKFELDYDFRPYSGKLSFLNKLGLQEAYATRMKNYAKDIAPTDIVNFPTKIHEGVHEILAKLFGQLYYAQRLEFYGVPLHYLNEFIAHSLTNLRTVPVETALINIVPGLINSRLFGFPMLLDPIFSLHLRNKIYLGLIAGSMALLYM